MTRIINLKADNFKRLRAVDITPTDDLVVISGRNGQGKTSVLDAITAALGGTNSKQTPKPIREGASASKIVLETEDLIITRTFGASGSRLVVTGKDGIAVGSAQKKLDALLGRLSLDPLAFTQLDERKQRETLLDLVELPFDPAALDAERAAAFEDRTVVNRDLKALHVQQSTFAVFPADTPTEEVSVTDLLAQYRAGEEVNRGRQRVIDLRNSAAAEVQRIERELARAKDMFSEAVEALKDAREPVDLEAIQQQIDNAEQINAQAREYSAYLRLNQRIADVKASADLLTEQIQQIDQRKADGLKAAKFPGGLPLGFDETGVLLNGIPFKQASGAEQLRASLAMAIALNPALRVIRIADGSLLDSEGLALVSAMATEHDCQVWIEVVSDGDGFGFMIEDGEVLDPDVF